MRTYDFTPLYRNFVGFDRMATLIDAASQSAASQSPYPPYNVAQVSEDDYRIELAVAGFSQDDFDIETKDNILTVTASKSAPSSDNDSVQYLHRGIAERGFERRFQLADHVCVEQADLQNGLLTLSLRREVPEALKPRKIAIGADVRSKTINKTGNRDQNLTAAKPSGKAKAA